MATEQIWRGLDTDLPVHSHQAGAVRLIVFRDISIVGIIPIGADDARVLARKSNSTAGTLKDQGVDHVADFGWQIEEWEFLVFIRLRLHDKNMTSSVWTFGHQDRFQGEGLFRTEFDGLSEIFLVLLALQRLSEECRDSRLEELTTAEVPLGIVHWIFRTIRSLLVIKVALKSSLSSTSLLESSAGSGSFLMAFLAGVALVF